MNFGFEEENEKVKYYCFYCEELIVDGSVFLFHKTIFEEGTFAYLNISHDEFITLHEKCFIYSGGKEYIDELDYRKSLKEKK